VLTLGASTWLVSDCGAAGGGIAAPLMPFGWEEAGNAGRGASAFSRRGLYFYCANDFPVSLRCGLAQFFFFFFFSFFFLGTF
jgi:hypothetical protein